MKVKVSSKYQVVIPEDVRAALGIEPGLMVDVVAKGGIAYLVPIPELSELQKIFKGKLSGVEELREKKDKVRK